MDFPEEIEGKEMGNIVPSRDVGIPILGIPKKGSFVSLKVIESTRDIKLEGVTPGMKLPALGRGKNWKVRLTMRSRSKSWCQQRTRRVGAFKARRKGLRPNCFRRERKSGGGSKGGVQVNPGFWEKKTTREKGN